MFAQKWAILIALSFSTCAAQTAIDKPPEPESIGVFFYLDSATQTLKQLPTEEFKKHRGGTFSVSSSVEVSGPASPFRLAANEKTTFVFKVFKDEEAGKARLFQFTIKGGEREYGLGKQKGRDYVPNPGLSISVAKFGESSYKLTPGVPLAPGEYALTMGPQVFTFGVSASGK